ncbi:unnamed protein product [Citrullus colocynthis]|uniref:Uncharacterized protein n=1 Tax=Citrullus colocynthis TaxID=252529 RepID=A0ABP0Z4Z4_9ROSI
MPPASLSHVPLVRLSPPHTPSLDISQFPLPELVRSRSFTPAPAPPLTSDERSPSAPSDQVWRRQLPPIDQPLGVLIFAPIKRRISGTHNLRSPSVERREKSDRKIGRLCRSLPWWMERSRNTGCISSHWRRAYETVGDNGAGDETDEDRR